MFKVHDYNHYRKIWQDKSKRELNQGVENLGNLPQAEVGPHYTQTFPTSEMAPRIVVVVLSVLILYAIITALILAFSVQISSFTQNFINAFTHIDYTKLAIGCSVTVVVIAGASIIIYRVRTRKEGLLAPLRVTYTLNGNSKTVHEVSQVPEGAEIIKSTFTGQGPARGALTEMDKKLETVCIKPSKGKILHGYLDRTTLDKKGNGKAFIYWYKDINEHYNVCGSALIGLPFYLIGVIVYNLLRTVIIPFYVLVQCVRDACGKHPLYPKERKFTLIDVGYQFGRSLFNIIQAPFYAVALLIALIYALVNPMGGRKLASEIERDWNGEMTTEEGFWIFRFEQKLWQFEGGGGPLGLGRNGYFLTGCYQPFGVAEIKNGKITGYWITALTDPRKLVSQASIKPVFYEFTTFTEVKNAQAESRALKDLLHERADQE